MRDGMREGRPKEKEKVKINTQGGGRRRRRECISSVTIGLLTSGMEGGLLPNECSREGQHN